MSVELIVISDISDPISGIRKQESRTTLLARRLWVSELKLRSFAALRMTIGH